MKPAYLLLVPVLLVVLHACSSRKIEEKYVGCYVPPSLTSCISYTVKEIGIASAPVDYR